MQPIFGIHAYKNIQHSNPVKVPLWAGGVLVKRQLTWDLLTSPDMMIVTEVGAGTARGATRRCSSGAEFAVASRDTHRFSVQDRALSTAPSGRHCVSSGAETCHQFPDPGKP